MKTVAALLAVVALIPCACSSRKGSPAPAAAAPAAAPGPAVKADDAGPGLTLDSPKVQKIEKVWAAYRPPVNVPTRDIPAAQRTYLVQVLNLNLTRPQLRELARSCEALPADERARTDFQNAMLGALAAAFADAGDRESLVGLLALRCPSRIDSATPTEYYLARSPRLTDGVTVLGDAYSRCREGDNRTQIAAGVRRAFSNMGVRADDEASWVSNAMRAYTLKRTGLSVNAGYCDAVIRGGRAADTTPLYVTAGTRTVPGSSSPRQIATTARHARR